MGYQQLTISTVGVIGAGVSGVAAAIHLKRAGLDVTVYERNERAGGIWIYDDRIAKDASYPSEIPSVGDSPQYEDVSGRFISPSRQDSPMRWNGGEHKYAKNDIENLRIAFAPPGPCYKVLKNNVSTIEMEMTRQTWKEGTGEFVPHQVLADYIQDAAESNGIIDCIFFNTRVNQVKKVGSAWEVDVARLVRPGFDIAIENRVEHFDAMVVASGHYHAPNIPDISGLSEWQKHFPESVSHSKRYRNAEGFEGQNILLVGAGVSSVDIARDLGTAASSIYQSSRSGPYDLPSHLLPANGARIGAIQSFDALEGSTLTEDGSLPGTITLQSGDKLCGIHKVIVCTGYHVSFPFIRQYHADSVQPSDADDTVIVTNGQQTHNLHKDIFYIPDPTLAFIGVPYHVATFTCFEYAAMALASVFSGNTKLPATTAMRDEYRARLERKGAGRTFHSLKGRGEEIAYVDDLRAMLSQGGHDPVVTMLRHSKKWLEAYVRRTERQKVIFSTVRDPDMDRLVLSRIKGC